MIIYTHIHVDLDAIFSVNAYALLHHIPIDRDHIRFVAQPPLATHGAILIDIGSAKGEKSYFGSHFHTSFPPNLVAEIDAQDSEAASLSTLPLVQLLNALREGGIVHDLEILQYFTPMVKGFLQIQSNIENSEKYLKSTKFISIGPDSYRFIILDNIHIPPEVLIEASKKYKLDGAIYCNNGTNYGITIYPSSLHKITLKDVHAEGWFTHKDGFLFSWGSRKSPRHESPPNINSMIDFIQFLLPIFKTDGYQIHFFT